MASRPDQPENPPRPALASAAPASEADNLTGAAAAAQNVHQEVQDDPPSYYNEPPPLYYELPPAYQVAASLPTYEEAEMSKGEDENTMGLNRHRLVA